VHFTSIFSVFSIMAGWIAEILFMLFLLCIDSERESYLSFVLTLKLFNLV